MILIISKNSDRTTIEVMKWLSALGKKYIRVHEDEVFEIKTYRKKLFLESDKSSFFLNDISSVWYRRGGLKFKHLQYKNPSINIHMSEAQYWLQDYVIKILESKKHINKQSNSHVNKLWVLECAKKIGLDVPDYFLAENTDEVMLNKTITKSITGNVILQSLNKKTDGIMYTSVVEKKEKEDFFISFFQEKIEKDFEIRSFYLNGKIWSFAIISQNDNQTKTDFRKYNIKKPNRTVPYNLPKDVEEMTCRLMVELDLNCGSLDFMKKENNYYFLEVNPVGQFTSLSASCNYVLEKEIANYL